MTGLRIVIEGLDGSGKTTLGNQLSQNNDFQFLPTPLPELKEYRAKIDQCLDPSPMARISYYTANVIRAGELAREQAQAGKTTIIDRYWLSTRVYGSLQESPYPFDAMEACIPPVDYTFFLFVPLANRRQRMKQRGHLEHHDRLTLNPLMAKRIQELYLNLGRHPLNGKYIELDCTYLSVSEIEQSILNHISKELL